MNKVRYYTDNKFCMFDREVYLGHQDLLFPHSYPAVLLARKNHVPQFGHPFLNEKILIIDKVTSEMVSKYSNSELVTM